MNTEILIIEDNPVIRKELQTVLDGNKYHTSVIEDFSDVTEQVRLGILCIQIMRSLNPYFFFSFPWPVVLIYSAVLLAVQLILIAYTTGNLKKQSLVDQIKTMD